MIPNKTESQILYQQFKYFDLDSTGFCTLQNFIRVQNRVGVVLPKVKDFEKIFQYFCDAETSLLNYKHFCNIIFNLDDYNQNNHDDEVKYEKDFVSILINKLLDLNGPLTLLELLKNMQMIDFEGNKRLNSDEFLTALKRTGIKLDSNEIQSLFLGQNYFVNGVVKYQILIDILLGRFWDEKKNSLSEEIFFILTNEGRKVISLNDMKNTLDKIVEESNDKKFLMNFIEKYKIINKNRINQNLILNDLIKFLKFYGFGQDSYSFLENLLSVLKPEEEVKFIPKKIERKNENNNKKMEYIIKNDNKNENYKQMRDIFEILREKLYNYSRKTFFNFIKHFKYYDNNSDFMTKYNFSKVLKDFNINLEQSDLEKIFAEYGTVNNEKTMNYKNFINDLISEFTNEKREKVIKYIYGTIEERGNKFNRDIDLSFLKEVYNGRKNYFVKEEADNRLEFEDCLELYNYIYKGNKNEMFNLDYFLEFYKCVSFLVKSDEDFIQLMSNEWRVPLDYIENEIQENKYDYINESNTKENYEYENDKKPKLIEKLKNKKDFVEEKNDKSLILLNDILKSRDLRGILYLHLEFINSCHDLSKITFNDFVNVLEIQHINLSNSDMRDLFNIFASKNNPNFLNFSAFIRNYKIQLNENKLSCVEQAFSNIDTSENDKVPLNLIKKKFKANNHPDVLNGIRKEEDIILEFLDCFNINYEILNLDSKNKNENSEQKYIDFEIFANFYEYVSFIYPDNNEFEKIVNSAWN
jgi:Ca2+-binding EF-hand superfamily protein